MNRDEMLAAIKPPCDHCRNPTPHTQCRCHHPRSNDHDRNTSGREGYPFPAVLGGPDGAAVDQAGRSLDRGFHMNMRDEFAAAAMQALIGTTAEPALTGLGGAELWVARAAYRMADAMMIAKEEIPE